MFVINKVIFPGVVDEITAPRRLSAFFYSGGWEKSVGNRDEIVGISHAADVAQGAEANNPRDSPVETFLERLARCKWPRCFVRDISLSRVCQCFPIREEFLPARDCCAECLILGERLFSVATLEKNIGQPN